MSWVGDYHRIELAADRAAAAVFAGAVGIALSAMVGEAGLATLLSAAVAFRLTYAGLRRIPSGRAEVLPAFQIPPLEPVQVQESPHLGEFAVPALRLVRSQPGGSERDASGWNPAQPTRSTTQPPDATQALSDALAHLRLSLR